MKIVSALGLIVGLVSDLTLNAAEFQPVKLTCEFLQNPQGIDVSRPRLSWQFPASVGKGLNQTGYRILVASSPELLAQDRGNLWDSGSVASNQSVLVEYAGAVLASRDGCYWKVRAVMSDGRTTQWSEVAHWSMGLLQPQDWTAKWISIDRKGVPLDSKNSPMLRTTFRVEKPVRSAQVSICGLGYYEMYLNGAKVGDHVLDPTFTTFHQIAHYVTYDLSRELTPGVHGLGVQLGNGAYNQEFADSWRFHEALWRAFPQMLLQLDIVYADGSRARVVSDETWKASTGPITWDQLRMGVMYDARKEQPGWATTTFDDSSWKPAVVREGIRGRLAAQMAEPIKIMDTLRAKEISEKDGVYTFDFGQNIAGWTQLKVTGPAGTKVTLDHGGHSHVYGKPLQTSVYTLKGKGTEVWEPTFAYYGFGKVKVTGLPAKPDEDTVVARVVHTAFENRGMFECSNPLLNQIVSMSRWSYRGNFVGFPTDCPHREKNGWTADAHIAAELGLLYFGSEAAYARWMLNFQARQNPDGKLPPVIPDNGDWALGHLDGPAWESAYLIIPWHLFEYRGDRRTLMLHYENYKRWLGWYRDTNKVIEVAKQPGLKENGTRYKNPQQVNQDNIICFGIGDWPPNKQTPFEITSTAYYYNAARIIARVASMLGRQDDAREYDKLADAVKAAFIREFYDEAKGTFPNNSLTATSCALYFDLIAPENRQKLADHLADTLRKNGYKPEVGCLGSKYLLRVLADYGHADVAYKIVTRTEKPGWGSLAAKGRTTLPEGLDGKGSDNHVFLGDVAAWMMEYLGGIRHDPEHPGFQQFLIKPQIVGNLTWVKTYHDSPYGRIISHWKIEGGKFVLDLTVPVNSTAMVSLPGDTQVRKVGSGNHQFETSLKR